MPTQSKTTAPTVVAQVSIDPRTGIGMRSFGTRSASVVLTAVIGAVGAAGGVAGCGGERLAEQLGEQAIDGQVDIEDDGLSITDEQGNQFGVGSGAEIPATWPADVPLFTGGGLVLAASQADGTATALWELQTSVTDAAAMYDRTLTDAGFTLEQDADLAGTIVRTYRGELHTVNVTVARTGETTNLSVSVQPK